MKQDTQLENLTGNDQFVMRLGEESYNYPEDVEITFNDITYDEMMGNTDLFPLHFDGVTYDANIVYTSDDVFIRFESSKYEMPLEMSVAELDNEYFDYLVLYLIGLSRDEKL